MQRAAAPLATDAALTGVTVLDLASAGPAPRCSRILADYGATVVKIAPPEAKNGVQVEPAYHAFAATAGRSPGGMIDGWSSDSAS